MRVWYVLWRVTIAFFYKIKDVCREMQITRNLNAMFFLCEYHFCYSTLFILEKHHFTGRFRTFAKQGARNSVHFERFTCKMVIGTCPTGQCPAFPPCLFLSIFCLLPLKMGIIDFMDFAPIDFNRVQIQHPNLYFHCMAHNLNPGLYRTSHLFILTLAKV